jgi:uncharacterized OB-fold protein
VSLDGLDQETALQRRDGLTEGFWAASSRHELVRPVCDACGTSFFSPRWACPTCLEERWSYVPSTGRGTIYSHTVVFRGPDDSWTVPYVLAIVDMEEGWSMLSRLLVADAASLADARLGGRAVEVTYVDEDRPPHRVLPAFVLVGSAA